jgi:hypothetical protein
MADELTNMVTRVRKHLPEATADIWTDANLEEYIETAVEEFSEVKPRVVETTLYVRGGRNEVDLSSLTTRYKVLQVEYEVDNDPFEYDRDPRMWRNFEEIGDFLYLDLKSLPSPDVDVSGTADGDVASHLQDDTNAQFTAAMATGSVKVKNTDNGWVSYCTAYTDTGDITLAHDIFPDGDENYNVYEPVQVVIKYSCPHTLADGTQTFSTAYDRLIAEGATAHAWMVYAAEIANSANIGGQGATDRFAGLARMKMNKWYADLEKLRKRKVIRDYPDE